MPLSTKSPAVRCSASSAGSARATGSWGDASKSGRSPLRVCSAPLAPDCRSGHTERVFKGSVMKIAIGGKGGSGKTTIAGTLARVLAAGGSRVVALDDDSNPNLAITVGVPAGRAAGLPALPRDFLEERQDDQGQTWLELKIPTEEFIDSYGVRAAENLTLLVMGQPSHGGSG